MKTNHFPTVLRVIVIRIITFHHLLLYRTSNSQSALLKTFNGIHARQLLVGFLTGRQNFWDPWVPKVREPNSIPMMVVGSPRVFRLMFYLISGRHRFNLLPKSWEVIVYHVGTLVQHFMVWTRYWVLITQYVWNTSQLEINTISFE